MRINLLGNKIPSIKRILPKIDLNSGMKKSDIFIECTPDMFKSTTLRPDFGKINTPITDENEYKALLAKLKHTISHNGNYAYFTENDIATYGKVDLFEHGLIPYCGQDDCHRLINAYLGSRLTKLEQEAWKFQMPYDLDTIPDVIRLLEYSLNRLDNKYGKYKGIVYRQGVMSETPNQYISTTINPYIATELNGGPFGIFTGSKHFSIIQTQNGHKIMDFQKEANSAFANSEQEILMPFQNRYKKLTDEPLSKELSEAKEQFASILFENAKRYYKEKINRYTPNDIYKLIDVYVQKQ